MKQQWEHAAYVESESEPGHQHEVKRHITKGRLGCSCHAYRFMRGSDKTCKHLRALLGLAAAATHIDPRVVAAPVRVTSGGEMFTVTRRAINFENLTA